MAKYQIENTQSGVIFGVYEGEDEKGALDAFARDAGYRDYAHADSKISKLSVSPGPFARRPGKSGISCRSA